MTRGAKSLPAKAALRLSLAVPDAALVPHVTGIASRIGVVIRVESDGSDLQLGASETIAHALRVHALRALQSLAGRPLDLSVSEPLSARAEGWLGTYLATTAPRPQADRAHCTLREGADGRIALTSRDHLPIDLGEPPEADAAIRAARNHRASDGEATNVATSEAAPASITLPDGAEARARAIAFGPSRTLSEPSSRRVLEAFGLPSGGWRLAENAARAAVHARAIGYPVDLRIASPDASCIDEPAFTATGLRAPSEVRDGFRFVTREVKRLVPDARVLGVSVTPHLATVPRLRVALIPEREHGLMQIELDDPIGRKLAHPIVLSTPVDVDAIETALLTFDARDVLPPASTALSRSLIEMLVRLGRISYVLADTLTSAEIAPLLPDAEKTGWLIGGARVKVRGIDMGDERAKAATSS